MPIDDAILRRKVMGVRHVPGAEGPNDAQAELVAKLRKANEESMQKMHNKIDVLQRHCWAGRTSGKESVGIQRGYASLPSRWYERWLHAMHVCGVGGPAPPR